MAIISISDLAELVGGGLNLGQMPAVDGGLQQLPHLATDIARLRPGDVYWELPRQRFTAPADVAFAHGAAGIVTSRRVEPWAGRFALRVADPQRALAILAAWVRQRFTGTLVAVHGVAGESSPAATIARLLGSQGRSRAILGGSPEESGELQAAAGLCSVHEDDRFVALDVHVEDFFGQHCISHLCCPHIAVIYRLHKSNANHLSVRSAAERLLSELPESGFAILNGDEPLLQELAENCQARCLWFSKTPRNDMTVSCHLEQPGTITLRTVDGTVGVTPPARPLPMENLMAACCVAAALRTPAEQIQRETRELVDADGDNLNKSRIRSWSPVDTANPW